MRPEPLDRSRVRFRPLAERANKVQIERDAVPLDVEPENLSELAWKVVRETAARILAARAEDRPVMLAFGAHSIKNGLGPLLAHLIRKGWVTHLATNGAAIIHDWEFAYQGASSEDVRGGVARGEFGNWQETGFYINLAINTGAWQGRGYGESVGAFISNEGLVLPSEDQLHREVRECLSSDPAQAAAAADLLALIRCFSLPPGAMSVPHRWKRFSLQAAAFELGVPLTGHPMFGHDIIYNHPMNCGACIGRAAQRDFLTFAGAVSRLEGGVYLSIGSAVMSPMVFEKSFSMAQNLALQRGEPIRNHFITVVDLAESRWDWSKGEPPESSPDYYIRFCKSFSRMGGELRYASADNRDFLLALAATLEGRA